MTTVNDLPIELLSQIFSYLSINGIVNARSVSNLWRNVADKQQIKDLVILDIRARDDPFYYFNDSWSETGDFLKKTDDKIDKMNDVLKIDLFGKGYKLFRFESYQLNLLNNLKRLKIDTLRPRNIYRVFSMLYRFPVLEQLECDMLFPFEQKLVICHDNLKILKYLFLGVNTVLELDLPNLQCLHFDNNLDDSFLKISYPKSLKHLRTCQFWDFDNLSRFENLETIDKCWDLDFDSDFLIKLPKLTVIRFWFDELARGVQDHAIARFSSSMTELIETRYMLNRENSLAIYLNDVELRNVDQLEDLLIEEYSDKFHQRYEYSDPDSDMEF